MYLICYQAWEIAEVLSSYQYLSRPDLYKQDYTHTDVRLVLGWLAVIAAGGTGLYGWKIEFEEAKPVVWVGVLLFVIDYPVV
jgi:signal peptidase complex subunit 2